MNDYFKTQLETVDFFTLLRSIEQEHPDQPRIGESSALVEENFKLGQEPHVDASCENVTLTEKREDGKLIVHSRFMGMLGPQGALPLHTTYEAVHWQNMRDPAFARFLDVFNQRFQQLFFRGWANARMVPQAERPKDNQFISYLGSAIGIGHVSNRNRDVLHDYTKLSVAGILSSSVKSAARIERFLAWLFKAKVSVQQFVGIWLPIERDEQLSLGMANCSIGDNSILGKSAYSLSDKFRVRIQVANLGEFESFLPNGKNFQSLSDAIIFYTGNSFMHDVEIGIAEAETKPICIGQFGKLGWTGWLNPKVPIDVQKIRWDCRFHPSEIAKSTATTAN